MPERPRSTTQAIDHHLKRRMILGRLELARQKLSAPGGQTVQRGITRAIAQIKDLMKPDQALLGALGSLTPYPVDRTFEINALRMAADEQPLRIAYHLLDVADLGLRGGPEAGIVKQCREICRAACIKAELEDPAA